MSKLIKRTDSINQLQVPDIAGCVAAMTPAHLPAQTAASSDLAPITNPGSALSEVEAQALTDERAVVEDVIFGGITLSDVAKQELLLVRDRADHVIDVNNAIADYVITDCQRRIDENRLDIQRRSDRARQTDMENEIARMQAQSSKHRQASAALRAYNPLTDDLLALLAEHG